MATTPLSATVLAHFFTNNEKINFIKVIGVLIGFFGVIIMLRPNKISPGLGSTTFLRLSIDAA